MTTAFKDGLGLRSEQILRDLQAKIVSGRIPVGASLPSERELCTKYQVNRSTIRRAISRLQVDGLITVRHRSGMRVNSQRAPVSAAGSRIVSVMFSVVPELLARVQEHALASGFLVCAFPRKEMGWNPESERTFLEHVRRDRHQGLLAFCTSESPHNDDLLARMSQEGIRIIHIEHYREEPPDQNFILPDYRQAGRLAAEHLHKAGYRTIIFSHTQQDWPGARLMQQGFEEATRSSGEGKAPTYGTYVYPINDHLPECAQAIRNYMRGLSPSTGILCTNTFIANGIIAFAREAGLRCPDELGIVTAPWMDFHIPFEGLDTVEFDRTGYLLKALDAVMRPEWPVIREYAEPRIVRRGSTTGMRQKR